jgi:hypothetical protein
VDWIKGEWKDFLLDEVSSPAFANCALIESDKVRQKVIEVMNNPYATFGDGEQAWVGLMPYFWEKAVVKSH